MSVAELAQVSIIIVNWNSGPLLARCVASVLQAQMGSSWQAELVIADNGSTDDSLHALPQIAAIHVLRLGRNLGFGAACNRAIATARGEYILLLNPDCEMRTGSLDRCLSELQRTDLKVGICGVGLEDESGHLARGCHRFPGFGALVGSALGLHAVWPGLAESRMVDWDHRSDRTVDHVIGAFYLMRRDVFLQVGGFDERFFVYLEDLDLSLRVARAGWVTRYLAEPRAFHMGGGVSRQVKAQRLFYATRSRLLYAFKHLPAAQAWLHALATLLIEPWVRSVHCLVRASWPDLRFTWQGFGLLYRDLPRWMRTAT